MRKNLHRLVALVALLAAISATQMSFGSPAYASATQCGKSYVRMTCTDVVGEGLQVNAIRVRQTISACTRLVGHFQMFGTSFNINTADQVYDVSCVRPLWFNSGWHYPNKQVADGSYICGRFWRKVGTTYQGYGTTECVKAHR